MSLVHPYIHPYFSVLLVILPPPIRVGISGGSLKQFGGIFAKYPHLLSPLPKFSPAPVSPSLYLPPSLVLFVSVDINCTCTEPFQNLACHLRISSFYPGPSFPWPFPRPTPLVFIFPEKDNISILAAQNVFFLRC